MVLAAGHADTLKQMAGLVLRVPAVVRKDGAVLTSALAALGGLLGSILLAVGIANWIGTDDRGAIVERSPGGDVAVFGAPAPTALQSLISGALLDTTVPGVPFPRSDPSGGAATAGGNAADPPAGPQDPDSTIPNVDDLPITDADIATVIEDATSGVGGIIGGVGGEAVTGAGDTLGDTVNDRKSIDDLGRAVSGVVGGILGILG